MIWSMANTGADYDDPRPDYYIRHNPERVLRNATRQLERLGYSVTLSATTQTA
jgi:hypothetical protein